MSQKEKSNYKNKRGKRDKMIGVWCTQDEHDWIQKHAGKVGPKGISKGRYCREVILRETAPPRRSFYPKDQQLEFSNGITLADMERLLDHDLPKIGNNLNQLTRHVNEQRNMGPKQTEEIQAIRKEISKITEAILQALK